MLEIIDFHVHLPVAGLDRQFTDFNRRYEAARGREKLAIIQNWGKVYEEQWLTAWSFPEPGPSCEPGEAAALWHNEARKAGLHGVVFVTGGGNAVLADALAPYGGYFAAFAHHHPEEEAADALLEEAILTHGLKGYKIFAPLVEKPLADRSFEPLWRVAERTNIPVLVHCGILGGGGGIASGVNISPLSLEPVARAFPTVPFIIPHFGCGYVRDLLQLCWACANVHVDTSGNNEWTRWHPYPLTLEDLFRRFYETVGAARIIFGSDSSWFPRGFARRYLEDQLRACRRLRLPEEDLSLIFGGNARRLLAGVRHD
ncbi:MAG: amidohydrolase family protein [Bacillota bacterium]